MGANAGRQMTTPASMGVGVPDDGGDAGDEGGRGCNIVKEGVSGDRWRGEVSEPRHGAAEVQSAVAVEWGGDRQP